MTPQKDGRGKTRPPLGSELAGVALRHQAEDIDKGSETALSTEDVGAMSPAEMSRVLHELRVHQIELELQNEELRRTQVELDAAKERYFDLYDLAPIGYCSVGETGLILEMNLTGAILLGVGRGEIVGQPFSTVIEKEDHPLYYQQRARLVATGRLQTCELRLRRKDNSLFWGHLTLVAAQEPDGSTVHRLVLRDVSDRRQAEKELRESEQNFRTLANSGMALIWTSGVDKLCNYFNQVWLQFTGRSLAEELGNGWLEGVHPADLQGCLNIYSEAFDLRQKFRMEYRLRRFDGTYRWIVDEGCPRYDSSGEFIGYIGHCLDISEHKQDEEEKKRLGAQLYQAQKMEAIGTLAGGIAHDFNNILGAIIGYAEMIHDDLPPGSTTSHDISQVLKAGNRAKDLVKQILAFSRQTEVHLMPLQPATIIRESIKMLRASLPATIVIKQYLDRNTGIISGDPTQIHQIMMNLCTNAFHAMERNGGTLTISLRNTVLAYGDSGLLSNMLPGNYLHLSIKDSGVGMAPEVQKKIFDPFFTTKEVGKGTGLGLSMVYGIIQSYGGSIHCQSSQGEGTTFDIFLPTVVESVCQEAGPVEASPYGNEHILLVDDEDILVEMGKKMLEKLGYQVTARTKSTEALAAFLEQPDSFDMVISDQTMPDLTGVDLARQILKKRPGLPIILCTGYSSLISAESTANLGIKGFIMKPLAKKELADLVRKLFDENEGDCA